MNGILWLASYPKSGNTWLRAFIHNLFTNAKHPFDINRMSDLTHGDSNAKWFQPLHNNNISLLSNTEIAKLRPLAHNSIVQTSSETVMVKTHNAMVEDGGAPMITPHLTVAAIYIIRNPLDVAISYADHLGVNIDKIIEAMANKRFRSPGSDTHVPEIYCDWSTHVKSWTNKRGSALLILRYEDMQTNPTKTFSQVAKFMGADPPRERLKRAIKFSSFKVLRAQENKQGFVERTPVQKNFFREGRVNTWRQKLSKQQIEKIVEYHHVQMREFDYLPEDL